MGCGYVTDVHVRPCSLVPCAWLTWQDMKVKFDTGDTWRASCALYSIFDGHGGTHAAQHAADVVASYIAEHASFWDSPSKAFKGAFDRCDADCMRMMEDNVSVCVCVRQVVRQALLGSHNDTSHTAGGTQV